MQLKAYGKAYIKTHLKITKVVDGDGLFVANIFNDQEEEVRFLGIDAPEVRRSKKLKQDERETHLPGKFLLQLGIESKQFLSNKVSIGISVTLMMEKQNSYDSYGRTLAYVFLNDGTCLNELMITEGYAKPYDRYYCEALSEYQQLNLTAKTNLKGLYKKVDFF